MIGHIRQGGGRRRDRQLAAAATAAGLMMALSACAGGGGGASSTNGAESKTLRVGFGGEALPNPALATVYGTWASMAYDLAYEPLIHVDPAGKLQPALASSWSYVKDSQVPNTVFEMKLRPDVTFSDGTPVNADAVVKWINYFVKSTGAFHGALGEGPVVTAVDNATVRVTLQKPNPSLGITFSDAGPNIGFVASPAAVDNPDLFASGTHGAGQYVLDPSNSVTGDHYTYKPNPKYFQQSAIKFNTVDVRVLPQASSRLQAQQSGQLDFTFGDTTTADAAKQANLKVLSSPRGVICYSFNLKGKAIEPALKDPKVREAIAVAIDRDSLAKNLLGGLSQPASAPLFSDIKTDSDNHWTYNPNRAKQLLSEAGYPNGFEFKAIVQGPYKGVTGEPLMRAVAQQLQAVGIKMNVTAYSTDAAYAADVFGDKASLAALVPSVNTVPTFYGSWLAKGGALTFFAGDPTIDQLYQDGATADDPQKAWSDMFKQYTSQAYMVPVITDPGLFYVSEKLSGVEVSVAHGTPLPTEWQLN